MDVSGSFPIVLMNASSEKQFANLCQTAALPLSDLQKSQFDLAVDSEPNSFVFSRHKLRGF